MELKEKASKKIDESACELLSLSTEIWNNPELNFKEFNAHKILTNFLEKEGFVVERSYTGIETAFRATFGSGKPNVCVICEYDALPEIGHACGHNLIAEAGIAAGLGLKAVLELKNAPKGTLTIMGTPAEEGGGGKIALIRNEAFVSVDFAMMVHPCPKNIVMSDFSCVCQLIITYTGNAAHAAAFPWEGVNALDAAVMAYTSISVLRQQMKPTWRVHGVITNGGAKPNIIPEKTELFYYIRALCMSDLSILKTKVITCFESAAVATGCKVEVCEPADNPTFANVKHNKTLAEVYYQNIVDLGVTDMVLEGNLGGSTDMGNVSYVVPSIHPMYAIGSGEVNHSREFTAVANTAEAHKATLTAAKAMAHTCIDVLTTDGLLEKVKQNFT